MEVIFSSLNNALETSLTVFSASPAKVQLLLFNNLVSGVNFLNLTVNQLHWNNTVFLFGYSNGRDSYVNSYLDVIDKNSTPTNTLVFMGSGFLNVKLENFWKKITNNILFSLMIVLNFTYQLFEV